MLISKYDIVLATLDPTQGSEQKGMRPCLVIQNNGANLYANTTVVCPISSSIRRFPHTLIVSPDKTNGLKKESRIDLLQIRTIDKSRIIKKLGKLEDRYKRELRAKLIISFDINDILV
jgi:mRNA interferase MazF